MIVMRGASCFCGFALVHKDGQVHIQMDTAGGVIELTLKA